MEDASIDVDRRELRFRILFEYYDKHHQRIDYNDSDLDYKKLGLPETEILTAECYLIDSGYLSGRNLGQVGTRLKVASINDISVSGIDFVERIMDAVLAKVELSDKPPEDTVEKITLFASKCLKSPLVETMCIRAFKVIVNFFQTGV